MQFTRKLMMVMMYWAIFFLVKVPANDITSASFRHSSVPTSLPYSSKLDNILETIHVCLRDRVERCELLGAKHRVGRVHMHGSKLIKWVCSTCHSLGSDIGVWDTLKLKKKKRKKTEAFRPTEESWSKRAIFGHFCEFQRVQDTEKERASGWEVQSEEIEKHSPKKINW